MSGFGLNKTVTANVTPSTIVFFDKVTPTTVGVVFTPNTPATTDILYVSSVNSSTWIWDGSAYISYAAPSVSSTEWYLYGTTIDAGSNKTASIQRSGAIYVTADSYFNGVRIGLGAGAVATNTVIGNTALNSNVTGFELVAIGYGALNSNTGNGSASIGYQSLFRNTSGGNNIGIGYHALYNNLTGSSNSGIGYQAGKFLGDGTTANTAGYSSVYIGANTKSKTNNDGNQTVIGYNAIGQGTNTVQIGNTSVTDTYLQGAVTFNNTYKFPTTDGTANQVLKTNGAGTVTWGSVGTVTSVGLTMPSAFGVANSPITTSGSLNVTAVGSASQYIRGDGNLADFPTQTGGGSAVVYYFNGGTNQGTFGGSTYYQMSKTAVIGTQVTFQTVGVNGLLTQYITSPLDPSLLQIPAGNWSFGTYFDSNGGTGSPNFYVELLKYDGTTFTLIATNSANPEFITKANGVDLYYSQLAVPETNLLATDRLAIRFYVNTGGRTVTFYNQGTTVSQVTTTVSFGLTALMV